LALKQKGVKQMGVKQGLGALNWEVLCAGLASVTPTFCTFCTMFCSDESTAY
jgi:hypothetical protein